MYDGVPTIDPIPVAAGFVGFGDTEIGIGNGAAAVERLRKAEVEHLDGAIRPQLDVRRLQVAVDDAVLVGGFDRFDDLSRDWQGIVERKRTLCDTVGEGRALDQLEHQRVNVPTFFESVDRSDVRMVERRENLRFALESRETVGIGREGIREDLERDVAIEPRIARAIHLAHAARAQP